MAKDPAFLFYSQDFATGTQFFTDEQVGKYIRLLCAQHQHGHLPEKHMLSICKTHDADVLSKFQKDEQGRYYNERLEAEISRRKKYTESRRSNAKHPKKQKNNKEAYAEHMDNHMETEIENINESGKGLINEELLLPVNVLEAAEMNQWTMTKARNTEFVKEQWLIFLKERNIKDTPLKRMDYIKHPPELYQYFLNWIRNKHPKKNGSDSKTPGAGGAKPGRSEINDRARAEY